MNNQQMPERFVVPAWVLPVGAIAFVAGPLLLGAVMPWALAIWLGLIPTVVLGALYGDVGELPRDETGRRVARTGLGRTARTDQDWEDAWKRAGIAVVVLIGLAVLNDWLSLRAD
ncbi:hypothetical protein [Brevundimonas sp.]|uniref:hypothetical protein n=1 Tax=Brevundimonas sp. TaxID=1871086 RepID=UPI0028A6BA48|nr:hypothetical protein [Brevundimonas sp.]